MSADARPSRSRRVERRRPERKPQTCPNPECDKHGEQTTMMGGCGSCGTLMVDWTPPEPTNQQLENFCAVLGIPVWPGWFDRNEEMRQGALRLHRTFNEAAAGDVEAQERLATWMDLFARTREATDAA